MLTHNVADALEKKWHPEKPSIFYVIDRHNGGVVAKYKVWLPPNIFIISDIYNCISSRPKPSTPFTISMATTSREQAMSSSTSPSILTRKA